MARSTGKVRRDKNGRRTDERTLTLYFDLSRPSDKANWELIQGMRRGEPQIVVQQLLAMYREGRIHTGAGSATSPAPIPAAEMRPSVPDDGTITL